jgi:hypothetical protein
MQNFHHIFGFEKKNQFFRQKLAKIAENCDHNIDPRCFCEKVTQNGPQPMFCQNYFTTFYGGKK